jgi:hypothetical protein
VPHRDQALLIFGPNGELLDRPFFGAGGIWRVNETNKGRWRSPKATNLPSGALDPTFTIRRFRSGASSDNPTYLAQREHVRMSMRKAGVPEE